MPDEPEALGLLALLLLHDSRRDARVAPDGGIVLLEQRTERCGTCPRSTKGCASSTVRWRSAGPARTSSRRRLQRSMRGGAAPDRAQIALLYDRLAAIRPSPWSSLNRAVAVALAEGPDRGLELIDGGRARRLPPALHPARADLLRRLGRGAEAATASAAPLEREMNAADRAFLERRIAETLERGPTRRPIRPSTSYPDGSPTRLGGWKPGTPQAAGRPQSDHRPTEAARTRSRRACPTCPPTAITASPEPRPRGSARDRSRSQRRGRPHVRPCGVSPGRIPIVVPPAALAPRCAAAITSPPPETTVQPRSASSRPTSSAASSCSAPLPITDLDFRHATPRHRWMHDGVACDEPTRHEQRAAGRSIVGGGFAGAYVARLLGKRGATIVSPENFMLYTPILPEGASGTLEPRHIVVPLRQMCPHAELSSARRRRSTRTPATVHVETEAALRDRVRAARARARADRPRPPHPRLAEHALGFKDLADAIALRNHVLRELERRGRGRGRDGGRAPARLRVRRSRLRGRGGDRGAQRPRRGTLRYYPARAAPQRWVLVDAAPRILPEIPTRLGDYALASSKRGVEIRTERRSTRSTRRRAAVERRRIPARTLVWTAGSARIRCSRRSGFRSASGAASSSTSTCASSGRDNVWALGDCAAGAQHPNARTDRSADMQHGLRQARRLAKNLLGPPQPYGYRMLGQVATLGRYKGIADVMGFASAGSQGGWSRAPTTSTSCRWSSEAPGRHRLDDGPLLPPRHRRAPMLGHPHRLE